MKKALRTIMIIIIVATILTICVVGFFFYKDWDYGKTTLPDNLSSTATVQKYFEYLDDGNNAGIKLITVQEISLESDGDSVGEATQTATESDKNYIPSLDLFTTITCNKCTLLDEKAEQYKDYADNAIVSVNFTYKAILGFKDESIPASVEGWEFCLVKETEDSSWKIISVTKN